MVDPLSINPGVVARNQVLRAPERHADRPGLIAIVAGPRSPEDRSGTQAVAYAGCKTGAAEGRNCRNRHPAEDDRTPESSSE
jgi:hypothetical protein